MFLKKNIVPGTLGQPQLCEATGRNNSENYTDFGGSVWRRNSKLSHLFMSTWVKSANAVN